ncbi:MAG: uracil-DNA glycosylase [Erysipelotrichaceae bacterium]|nr:uracil-DNA glycosylase [Erysipelotrichaceae bacterium]MDY6035752.1 uracil-DNA glycosylase [Bulleidia sp.]
MDQVWSEWLHNEWQQDYFQKLSTFLHEEYENKKVYPPKEQVFSAFSCCGYEDIKVVILGQDPYHQPGQAHGLCFSVNPGVKIPPSLLNIYKELQSEYGYDIPNNGCLVPWAKQGVFLLNTVMSVVDSKPQSHAGMGWETFTDHVIAKINESKKPVVFMLWGRPARSKACMIDTSKHLVLEAAHPSPLSAYHGFFGCHHFKLANEFLLKNGRESINWKIENI